jgi:pyruvate dehydrogenase E2 component (dihydrolipoamide acetyltransferase)
MSRELHMPSLGADMEAGTLTEWRVQPGSQIQRGDVVALVETEKGIIDIESFEEGMVEKLTVEPGTRVPVGAVLALLSGEAPAQTAEVRRGPGSIGLGLLGEPPAPPKPAVPAVPPAPGVAPAATPAQRHISPAARVRAKALGIDTATLRGTGPHGVITLDDIERATQTAASGGAQLPGVPSAASAAKSGTGTADVRARIRNAIAASMSRGKREIPHYYLQLAMDFSPPSSWLAGYNEVRPPPERILTSVLLIKATARAAAERPGFNGYYGPRGFEPSRAVHIGVAIALRGGGLVAPALFDADQKALPILMHELQDLVGRVRSGHMRSSEISSATLTITSLGDEGVDAVLPIIYPPQVAIMGFGSVLERPWVIDGRVEARPVLQLALAADHRVTDGRQGAQFLARVRDLLMRPAEL